MRPREFFDAYQLYARYATPKSGAGIGTGIGMMNKDAPGLYTIAANSTAEIAPDAPSDAYSGLFLCLKYVPTWLTNKPMKYSNANFTPPIQRSSEKPKK